MKNRKTKNIEKHEELVAKRVTHNEQVIEKIKKVVHKFEYDIFEYYSPYITALIICFVVGSILLYVLLQCASYITEVIK